MKSIKHNFDLIFLLGYVAFSFLFATLLTAPVLQSKDKLIIIPLIFICIIVAGRIWTQKGVPRSIVTSLEGMSPQQVTYHALWYLTLFCILATLVSWMFAFHKNIDLVITSPINAMRAITTHLHSLVPLESRTIYILIPPTLLYPFQHKTKFQVSFLILSLLIFTFFVQTKFGYLFTTLFLIYLFTFHKDLPFRMSRFRKAVAMAVLFGFCWGGLELIHSDIRNYHPMVKQGGLELTPKNVPRINEPTKSDTYVCQQARKRTPYEIHGGKHLDIVLELGRRTFVVSAEMTRLFLCLRENGWRPNFRGHQLFRLAGIYVPYYRNAFNAFARGHGTQINSAGSNVAADAYFNMGYFGVILAACLVAGVFIFFDLFALNRVYLPLIIYFKIYFIMVISQMSVLSGLVTVFPLFLLVALDIYQNHFRSRPAPG